MSIYIQKLAVRTCCDSSVVLIFYEVNIFLLFILFILCLCFQIERRIYYDEVEGLMPEWLEATSTLVLNLYPNRHCTWRGSPGKWRPIEDVALIVCPCDLPAEPGVVGSSSSEPVDSSVGDSITSQSGSSETELDPSVFPITVRLLSTIPVALHAIGGDDGPVDIGARLYMSSYFC